MGRLSFYILALSLMLAACATAPDATPAGKGKVSSSKKKKASPKTKTATKKKPRNSKNKGPSSDVPETYKKRKTACEKYEPAIREIAEEFNLEPELVMGVVKVESSFNPKCKSRVGARGLMQVMPRTAKHMKCGTRLTDPETNIRCGCTVLRRYLDIYDGNVIYGLAAYNAGPGNANPSAKGSYLPFNFKYVEKVLRWRNVFVRFGCK